MVEIPAPRRYPAFTVFQAAMAVLMAEADKALSVAAKPLILPYRRD